MTHHAIEILNALPVVVIEIDDANRVHYANDAAKALLFGPSQDAVESKPDIATLLASQEILAMIGTFDAAKNSLQNTNVLFVDANATTINLMVTGRHIRTEEGLTRAVLVGQRNHLMQEELAQSSRWAAAERSRADELSLTRDALQQSHDRLREMQTKMMEASRLAGMAEIASGAIHNVGNVLNGVNVGVKLIRDRVAASRGTKLGRLCDALGQQLRLPEGQRDTQRIAGFLSFFEGIVKALDTERATLQDDLDGILKKVEHIKNVVGSQQSYARSGGVMESVKIGDIVAQALSLQRTRRSGEIEIVQELEAIENFEVDRHNLLQILVNLVANAENSMIENDTPVKRVTISARKESDAHILLRVQDTGIGIEKALQQRIFSHGFTTRAKGSGFGLHNAALLVKKMRGQIGVTSDGVGKGATFWIQLPLQPLKIAA